MVKKAKEENLFGIYLKQLREQKGVSLLDVEKTTGISNAYLSQLETGSRKRLPTAERLRKIANYYNVTVHELLAKAGYFESKEVKETYEQTIDQAFLHAINDPTFHAGTKIDPETLTIETKKYVVEIYEKAVKRKLGTEIDQAKTQLQDGTKLKRLSWKIEDVKRTTFTQKGIQFIQYVVSVLCVEVSEDITIERDAEGLKPMPMKPVTGKGISTQPSGFFQSESNLLEQATKMAIQEAVVKIKGTDWTSVLEK